MPSHHCTQHPYFLSQKNKTKNTRVLQAFAKARRHSAQHKARKLYSTLCSVRLAHTATCIHRSCAGEVPLVNEKIRSRNPKVFMGSYFDSKRSPHRGVKNFTENRFRILDIGRRPSTSKSPSPKVRFMPRSQCHFCTILSTFSSHRFYYL
jgi:hypothetical protein